MKKIELSLEMIRPVLFECTQSNSSAETAEEAFDVTDMPDSDLLAASFGYDLGMDSLDFALFCIEVERKLNVKIDTAIADVNYGPKLTLAQFLNRVNQQ